MNFLFYILIIICIYSIVAVSLNLVLGYAGLLNLGHIAFFMVGAYSSVILNNWGVPFIIAFILAGMIASIFGFLLMIIIRNLKDDYFAIASLAFGLMTISFIKNLEFITNGNKGISQIPKPDIFGLVINSDWEYFLFVLLVAIVSVSLIIKISSSSYGRALAALRDNELNVAMLGKNTLKLKIKSIMFSAFFVGIAGSLYAHYVTFLLPHSFALTELILIIIILIVGGLPSMKGSLVATVIIIVLSEAAIKFIPLPISIVGPGRQLVFLSVLYGVILWKPLGLYGKIRL